MFKLTITLATGERITRVFANVAELDRARAEILASEADDAEFADARRVA